MVNFFDGKTAVITGAGGVLCGSFAKALAKQGVKIALLDINQEAVEKVAGEIIKSGGKANAYRADVLDKSCLEEVRAQVNKDFGACDILINGAGGNNPKATTDKETFEKGDLTADIKSFFSLDSASIGFVFDLNFLGTLLPTQVFTKDMAERGTGNILNISSMSAFSPMTKVPAYSAAKAGISNFTQWLAVYFAKAGIRCNAIAPGFFVTSQNEKLLFDDKGAPTLRTGKILAATPMGRFGKAEELNGALLFLLDDSKASFITGAVLPIDGGFSAYSGV